MIINILESFSFHTQWNAGILLFVLLSIVLYLFLLPTPKKHPMYKSFLFIAGLILIFVAVGSPLNLLGRIIFSAHMIQMVILLIGVVPLMILGFKIEVEKSLSIPLVKRLLLFVHRPRMSCILLFHGLFIGYHFPIVFNYIRVSYFLNYFYLFLLFIIAVLVWLPILSPFKEVNSMSGRQKLRYCVMNSMFFLPLVGFLIFSKTILYSIYIDPELIRLSLEVCLPVGETIDSIPEQFFELLLPFSPLKEQRLGGLILFLSQVGTFAGVGVFILFKKRFRHGMQKQ